MSPAWKPPGAIPPRLRAFGKFFDTSQWRAGDLLLFRDKKPDLVGRAIARAQKAGGYADIDAMWTHVALYLGDAFSLCEATFSTSPFSQGVTDTPLWDYCGDYVVRLRRPNAITTDADGWLLAIKALTQLRKDYNFLLIASLGLRALRGDGFWQPGSRTWIRPSALVCSTLYADAYARQTRRSLGEQSNGYCTPAYLSQSSEFRDIPIGWSAL